MNLSRDLDWRVASWFFFIVLVIVAASSYSPAHTNADKLVLRPQDCSVLSKAQQDWLSPEWRAFLEQTRVCAVRNSRKEVVVFVVSVQADLYYRAQPGNPVAQVKMPNPLLFLPSGQVAGSLPYNFPDDPPAELRVTFAHWEQDFPQRIDLYLTDPRAAGDRSLPSLQWDKDQKKYLAKGAHHE